jgi:outer membrane protein assembly factor BamB
MTRDRLFIHGERAYVAALEARTGKPLWRTEDARLLADIAEANDQGLGFKTTPYALCTPEALFLAGRGRRNVVAVRAADGAHLWTVPGGYNSTNLLFSGGALYAHIPSAMRLDPLTGALTQELGISKRSCARFTGCPEALFHRGSLNVGEGTTRYDLSAARASVLHAFRPPCNDGVIPAEGLLHITQWDCDCNLQLMGGIALAPVGGLEVNRLATDAERLQVLRSAGVPPAAFAIDPADWTTYRGDNERGACSTATVPQTVRPLWQAAAGCPSRPSAPTAAGGLVFVAGDDGQVRALDGSSGDERWRFPAGGAVRLPPSVWEGRAYVGSADGYVTCLEAASGKPLWRFRAAPYDRRTVIYGRLSSTWPVNTGVLVQDGVAYAGAGIINYDGTHVYALDARSGRLRWQNNTSGHLNPELRAGVSIQGGLALAPWALLLAGGNVTSPAQYALQDGHSLNDPPGPAPPHANRGSEVGVVHGRYALIGGPRLFTDPQDTISTTTGYGILGPDVAPGKGLPGRVPPAWGQGAVVLAAGGPVVCVDAGEFDAWLKVEDKKARMPWRWKAEAPRASVAAAITANAVVAVGRAADDQWCVAALDLAAGKELWVQPLPQAPVAGGLCIDREGRVVVTLSDGSVVCFG